MITSEFNKITGILEVKYSGRIQLSDLLEFGNQIYENSSLPRRLLMLTDVTSAKYEININDLSTLIENLEIHVSAYEYIKAAFIQSKPKETAYSMLMSSRNTVKKYLHEVFSTKDAAILWLLS